MKYIVSFSGGKNSTAMLIRLLEIGIPVDEIRYFDCGTWEFPQMHNHIDKVEAYIKRPIMRLRHKHTFDYLFSEIVKIKGKRKGTKGYWFPTIKCRWCTRIKISTLVKGISRDSIQYIGYSADEKHRFNPINKKPRQEAPLIRWGWNEKDCLDYCYSKGFTWDGLYNYFDRASCYCCPFQRVNALRNLRKHFPVLWQQLIEMQNKTSYAFRMNKITMYDLEKRFAEEEKDGIDKERN